MFEKTGIRSRRELVGNVFLAHHEPPLRDNERRVLEGAASRPSVPGVSRRNGLRAAWPHPV